MRSRPLQIIVLLVQLSFAASITPTATGQSNSKACSKPPEIATQPKTPQEYRGKWKKGQVHGRVAIVIDEDGHVVEAKLMEVSPKEAGDALLATAKTITFKPRPGCGSLKTDMIFTVSE